MHVCILLTLSVHWIKASAVKPGVACTLKLARRLFVGEKLDPRAAIAGRHLSSPGGGDTWQSGLFDANTWREANPGWARSVVTGRARLGGIAVGELTCGPCQKHC